MHIIKECYDFSNHYSYLSVVWEKFIINFVMALPCSPNSNNAILNNYGSSN